MGVKELVEVEGWPDTHASLLFKDAIADSRRDRGRRGCGQRARCSSVSRRRPSSGRPTGLARTCTASTRNPWNPERTPGGSSGGSAPRCRVGMMPICTGSDGGGSIRIPSAYSGLFGFKVSFGRVGDRRQLRQRAHFGARPDLPVGSRRGALRRRDRRAHRHRPHVVARGPLRSYEDAVVSGAAAAAPARSARRVDVDTRFRGVRSRSREARRTKPRSRSRPTPVSSWSTSTSTCRQPGRCLGDRLGRSTRRRTTSTRRAATWNDVTPVSRAGFESGRPPHSDQLIHAQQRRWELLARDRRRVRRGRPDPHADHRHDRVRRRGSAAARDRAVSGSAAWDRSRTPRRSTSRACPA